MGKHSFPLRWFNHCHGQISDRNNLREEGLIWLTVAEVSTHCGKEDMGAGLHVMVDRKQNRVVTEKG